MLRRSFLITTCAVALLAVPSLAAASERGPDAKPSRPVLVEQRPEHLRLGCRLVRADTDQPDVHRRGIACRWSATGEHAAVGYVLQRSVDGGEREVVHRGGLDRTRFLDTEVRRGHRYTYAVVVVDADGQPLGGGGPVTLGIPG